MLQRYDQIENLIRTGHHSESEGSYCEDLVRAFLRETLPKRFSVDTGFVLGTETDVPWRSGDPPAWNWKRTTASPQLDVIVHDTDAFAPVIRTGEFVIVLPDAVHAVIEVKKTLTSTQLQRGLMNLAATRHLVAQWRGGGRLLFTAIFAFQAEAGLVPGNNGLSATYQNRYDEMCGPFSPAYSIPDLLLVAPHVFLGRVQQDNYDQPIKVSWGPVVDQGINISGQLLLWHLMKRLGLPEVSARVRRFQWPEDFPFGGQMQFENPTEASEPLPAP